MKRFSTLLKIDLKLNIRNMNMVIFAIILPLVIYLILGMIYGTKPASPNASYSFMELSFSAMAAVSICAGGLMGLPLAISEYREKKILKHFKVTPISPSLLLFVELVIYVIYCIVSIILLRIVSLLFGVVLTGSLLSFIGSYLLTIVSTLSIGLMVGGIAKNAKQASIIASLLYFPMLIFSGTTLPIESMPVLMQKVVSLFPLTQGIELMKSTFLGISINNVIIPILVMSVITLVCSSISIRFFKWE